MLRIHIITKDNLNKEKEKNKWTKHTVAVIKEIVKDWLDKKIAESVLLFFKENLGKYLHSYMPIVSGYNGNMPNVRNFKGEIGEAKIIGVEPYKNPLKISKMSSGLFQFNDDDDIFITGTMMEESYWEGNDVFMLKLINTESFAIEPSAEEKGAKKKPAPKKTGAKMSGAKKIAKKKPAAKKAGVKKVGMKKPAVKKKTGVKKTAKKKPEAKKKTVAKKTAK